MKLRAFGNAVGLRGFALGRVTRAAEPDVNRRGALVYVAERAESSDVLGYAGAIMHAPVPEGWASETPAVFGVTSVDHLRDGDAVLLSPNGHVRTLFRPDSAHNVLFATERCNSYCLMCSQPPRDVDDSHLIDVNLRLISLMTPAPNYIGITGGEPTLLGEGLFAIVRKLKECLPDTRTHMLTNGRAFSRPEFTREFCGLAHPNLSLGIPLYADNAPDHDYVVQAAGAFDQTIQGMHSLARYKQRIEIRVVLHAHTVPRLPQLCEYIYRNLPFASHVALMGLEITGFAKANLDDLWVDPVGCGESIVEAANMLALRGMNVSIYNYPLCLLPPRAWPFAKRSISDWKQSYAAPCEKCSVRQDCGGFFKWAVDRYAGFVRPVA